MSVVLVTGASSGIGQSTAVEAARRGAGVILTYRTNPEGAHDTVAQVERLGGVAVALPLDVGRSDAAPSFVEQVARTLAETWQASSLTGLVNNAGLSRAAPFGSTTEGDFDLLVDSLLKGPYFLTQALLPLLADGASIVNTTSTSTASAGLSPGYSAYGAVKGAVVVWTRYLAKELGPRGIRANSVSPGPTRTRLGDDGFAKHPELIEPLAQRSALGRIGEGPDIGRVISFLLSDEAGWVTGQDIEVSGGFDL